MIVGDLIGAGEAQERGIAGETPNLAARLRGIAEPDMVVIAEGTRRLLGNLFELEDLGAKDLKGISGPTRAWAAVRQSSVESRFEALRTVMTPLVGRDEEIALLMRRWKRYQKPKMLAYLRKFVAFQSAGNSPTLAGTLVAVESTEFAERRPARA